MTLVLQLLRLFIVTEIQNVSSDYRNTELETKTTDNAYQNTLYTLPIYLQSLTHKQ